VRPARLDDLASIVSFREEYHDHPLYMHLRPERARTARSSSIRRNCCRRTKRCSSRGRGSAAHRGHPALRRYAELPRSPAERYCYVSSAYVARHSGNRACWRALLAAAEQWCATRGIERCGSTTRRRRSSPRRRGCPGFEWSSMSDGVRSWRRRHAHHDREPSRRPDARHHHFAHVRIGRV